MPFQNSQLGRPRSRPGAMAARPSAPGPKCVTRPPKHASHVLRSLLRMSGQARDFWASQLLVQQHLMRYNATYTYDPIFALGFVTVYDQLMDGYPNEADRDAIFKAYITALNEDPELYRNDAKKLEEWAAAQSGSAITDFARKDGEVEAAFKGIAERAAGEESFHYSRFFAIGLFRLLECANASDPPV